MYNAIVEDGVDLMGYTSWGCIDIVSESTNPISTSTSFAYPACFMLSTTDKYESSNFIYFPTIAIFTFFTFF